MSIGDLIKLGLGLAGKLGMIAMDAYAASHEEGPVVLAKMMAAIEETAAHLKATKDAHEARVAEFAALSLSAE